MIDPSDYTEYIPLAGSNSKNEPAIPDNTDDDRVYGIALIVLIVILIIVCSCSIVWVQATLIKRYNATILPIGKIFEDHK